MNIIQTWKTYEVLPLFFKFISNIHKLNPTCNYMFFSDNDIESFIDNQMPEYADTFYGLHGKIQQVDFFRYLVIYYYGGLYLDIDFDAKLPFDDLITTHSECYDNTQLYETRNKCIFPIELKQNNEPLLSNQNFDYLIGNYAFYAPKKHPFIKKIIDNIVNQRILDKDIQIGQSINKDDSRDVYVYYRTGPLLVTQSYIDYISTFENSSDIDISLIEPAMYMDNCFGDYGYHNAVGTWRHISSTQEPLKKA